MMPSRNISILKESFIPILLVLIAIFLLLLYSWFKADYDAQKVTIIEIGTDLHASSNDDDVGDIAEDIFSKVQIDEQNAPIFSKALKLVTEGKWLDTEVKYKSILADSKSSRAFNDLGVFYLNKNDPAKALKYFNQAINTVPLYDRAYFNRGVVLFKLDRTIDAINDYETMTTLQPNHFEAHYNKGVAFLKIKQYEKALRTLLAASRLTSGPRKAMALYNLGITYRRLNPPENTEAAKAFTEAIRLKPDYVEPRFALGAMEPNTAAGQAQALKQYKTILKLVTNYPKAYYNIGLIYTDQRKWRKAEEAYRNAIQFSPEYFKARYNLGLLYIKMRHWNDAILQFDWIIKRFPEHAESHFNMARALYQAKRYEQSLRSYAHAIEAAGGNYPEAYLNQGLVFKAMGNYPQATKSYHLALKLKEKYPEAWFNLGAIYSKEEKWPMAIKALKKAIALNKNYYQAWFNLAIISSKTNNIDRAINAYHQALAIKPDYPAAQINLAVRYARKKEYDKAIDLYKQVLASDKSYFRAWLNVGIAYQRTGKNDLAEVALVKALELEDNAKAMRYLGRIYTRQKHFDRAIVILNKAIDKDSSDWRNRLELAKTLTKAGKKKSALQVLEKGLLLAPNNKLIKKRIKRLKKELQ